MPYACGVRRALPLVVFVALLLGADADVARADAPVAEPTWSWASQTSSPQRLAAGALTDREQELQTACGVAEQGLHAVAARLVDRKIRGLSYLDLDGLTFAQRANGNPHVWPRAWIVSGRAMDQEATLRKLTAWRGTFHDVGERRCGVASGYAPDGTQIVAAIALDAVADLTTPLPVRTHAGTWLLVEAKMLVPTTGAHVVVVGPSGEPRSVPTSLDGTVVRARFAPDRPGAFTVQGVADVGTGPRPVVEAQLYADTEPPLLMPNLAAPGEAAGVGVADAREALMRMVLALRAEEHITTLVRDARLDAVALAHAQRMKAARVVGHDVGDGDPAQRLQAAGIDARDAGENVAHAQSVQLAHRALWASPSHRQNLQRPGFDRIGVAVLDDADGSVWVAEVFARDLR